MRATAFPSALSYLTSTQRYISAVAECRFFSRDFSGRIFSIFELQRMPMPCLICGPRTCFLGILASKPLSRSILLPKVQKIYRVAFPIHYLGRYWTTEKTEIQIEIWTCALFCGQISFTAVHRRVLVRFRAAMASRDMLCLPVSPIFIMPISQVDGQDYQSCFSALAGGRLSKKHVRLLLRCPGKTSDTRIKAKYQYTVSFRMFSPVPKGPEFNCNQEYYFLGKF